MTNKRFVFDPSIYHFTDTQTDKTYGEYNLDEVVDLLNELHKENRKLYFENKKLRECINEIYTISSRESVI